MTIVPVIARELRSQARQPFTFHLRVLGVTVLVAGCLVFGWGHAFTPNQGGALFGSLHIALFGAIWILVPFSAADCLSRERREGTLGLLFLTPLKATDIVMAKGLAHGLRATTLLVAVLPVLAIPFLLGGLTWQQAAMSALINFSSICWTLAAAVVASSFNRRGLRSIVVAEGLAVCALVAFACVAGFFMLPLSRNSRWMGGESDRGWLDGLALVIGGLGNWRFYGKIFTPAQMLWVMTQTTIASVAALAGAVMLAAWRIRRRWQEEPPPAWIQEMEKTFCTPVLWLSLFHRWMRWKLDRNPIGWLEQRRWTGRLVTWSWFAVVISIYSAVLSDRNVSKYFFRGFSGIQELMGWLLVGSIASSAAGSFRRERETGVLELLLVAPLTARQIVGGRVRGLWGQFGPAMALFLGVWLYFAGVFAAINSSPDSAFSLNLERIWFFGVTFLTLPVIGLYFSLRCRGFVSAFLLTLITGVVGPMILDRLAGFALWVFAPSTYSFEWHIAPRLGASLVQLALGILFSNRLCRCLRKRAFPLERTQS